MKRPEHPVRHQSRTNIQPCYHGRGWRWLGGATAIGLFCAAAAIAAETPGFRNRAPQVANPAPIRSSSTANPSGLNGPATLPAGSYQPEQIGFRHSSIFRSGGPIYNNPPQLPPMQPAFRTGSDSGTNGSVSGDFSLSLPSLTYGLPFLQQGFEPQDADLKTGPLFWKLRSLTGAVLLSDNIDLSSDNRESGAIAIMSIGVSVIAQITEGTRFALSGSLVYFPIEGKGGISGFDWSDVYNFGLGGAPLVRSQLVWNTMIGSWNVVLADDFVIGYGSYSNDFSNDFALFDGFRLDEESRAGRYVFRPPDDPGNVDSRGSDLRSNQSDETVISNMISASADRLIIAQTRLRVRIYREDLWYNQGGRGLPSLREGGSLSLASERPNLRFKPYLIFDAVRSDLQDSFDQSIRLGLAGPITDQLEFRGEYGHYWSGFGGDGQLWTLSLTHAAGPYTSHGIIYSRSLSSFNEEVVESIGYRISQIFGPKLTGDAYIIQSHIEDLRGDNPDRTDLHAGLRLNLVAGPKTSFRAAVVYGTSESEFEQIETWTGRLEMGYNFTDTLLARLAYQYQQYDSNIQDASYYENLVLFSITKYFR